MSTDTIHLDASLAKLIVGEREWPVRIIEVADTWWVVPAHIYGRAVKHVMRDRIHRVGFDNGWEVSIVWGSATHSSNHIRFDEPVHMFDEGSRFTEEPTHVECAVIVPHDDGINELLRGADDGILSYVSADELNELLDSVSRLVPGEPVVLEQLIAARAAEIHRDYREEPNEVQDHDSP